MEIELAEIRDFLASHPPFDRLPEEALNALPRALIVRYLRRGTPFPPQDAKGAALYVVRSGAVELRNEFDQLVDKFGEGDLYSASCSEANPEADFAGVTAEDSLFYLLSCKRFFELRRQHPEFDAHFGASLKARLRRALSSMQGEAGEAAGLMTIDAAHLVGRAPVHASPDTSIREAARLMTRERVSALLLCEGKQLAGILTDRDLRERCIAEGCDYAEPVGRIMSKRLVKVAPDTPAFEALMLMSRMNVHHLPVVGRDGVLGVISDTDLIRYQSSSSVYLVGDIHRAESPESVAALSRKLPELQIQLLNAGVAAEHLGQTISLIIEAINHRLIELALAELGPAPVPFAWLAVGSLARREQTAYTDQDHALLLGDAYQSAAHGDYFAQLAQRVADGLNACGFFYCPGGVMATTAKWRQPLHVWRGYFDKWISRPERKSLMLACNFFDVRVLYGETALFDQLRADLLQKTQDNRIFIAHLVANALHYRPPLGFFRNFVVIHGGEHDNALDLKRRGLIPTTDLARIYALAAGLHEIGTRERLRGAAEVSALSADGAEGLEDAFNFISSLRARHQAEQLKRGLAADNFIRPDDLSKLERAHLKDAFSAINGLQNTLSQRYQAERFF